MARIAITVGIAVGLAALGAVTGGLGLIPSAFGSALANGGALSAILGGMLGAGLGQAIGGVVCPVNLPNQFGPRLGDLRVSSSTNGMVIPIGYGSIRYAGNVIWSPGLVEHSKTTKQSSKGGPSYSSTNYTYTASFAVAFGESGGASRTGTIKKIWLDTKVVYDVTVGGNFSKYPTPTLYNGSQVQIPNAHIQATQGVDNTPAFRGLIYLLYEDFPLADFGNHIPNVGAQIDFDGTGSGTMDQRIIDICARAGVPSDDLDTSQVTGISIAGYCISGMSDAKSALQPIMAAFFVDACESDHKLRFVPRGVNDPVMTIPEDDIGLVADNAKLTEQFTQEDELPREVEVLFIDPAISYEQNKSQKQRSSRVVQTKQKISVTFPIVMTADQARQIAEKLLYLAWLGGKPFSFNLWKASYMALDATDVVSFVYEGHTYTMRANGSHIGVDFTSAITGVSDDQNSYVSTAVGGVSEGMPVVGPEPPADTLLYLFDLPYLQDIDAIADEKQTGFYWVMSSASSWPGGILNRSTDDSDFSALASSSQRSAYGVTVGTLGDPPTDCWTWDTVNTLDVDLAYGTLAGTTDAGVLNGDNVLIVGGEVIQYVNAVQTGDTTWTLSRLLRGRRNTEYASTGHAANEVILDPNTGMTRAVAPLSLIGALRYYRGVTVGQDLTTVSSETLTLAGNDLKPASPVHLTGARDGGNNLTIGWTRRTRYAGDWLNETGAVPLNEITENYSIEILSGVTVLRTIAWTGSFDGDGNPTQSYSAANQVTDGLTPGDPVTVRIYQISAVVGRGFPGRGTV